MEKLCQATDLHFGEKNKTENGWLINNNNQEECVVVSFETSVFINEIHIYESLNPGSIVKLEMLEPRQGKRIPLEEETFSSSFRAMVDDVAMENLTEKTIRNQSYFQTTIETVS